MSDPEGFLSRWSRKKRATAATGPGTPPDRAGEEGQKKDSAAESKNKEAHAATAETAEPIFDISKLPPIESIAAATDIRPFLAPGVPVELTRAALRRAWVADPAIRDYIGLSENAWDFNAPDGVPGFSHLPPSGDIKRMVAEIFGDTGREESRPELNPPVTAADKPLEETPAPLESSDRSARQLVNEQPGLIAGGKQSAVFADAGKEFSKEPKNSDEKQEQDVALQQNQNLQTEDFRIKKRSHGGALPK